MGIVGFYAAAAFGVMVLLAIVNSRIEVRMNRPVDRMVGGDALPIYFAQIHRDFYDLGLVESNQGWLDRLHQAFGEGDELDRNGEDLRLLGRPGFSLVAAATVGFSFGPDWTPEEIAEPVDRRLREYGLDFPFALKDLEELDNGSYRARLVVGAWSRELEFRLPGDVYREANALLEAEGFRVMQFATGGVSHAFALMELPMARKLFHSAAFDMVDPPGGDEVRPEGTPEKWHTWLY